MMVVEQVDLTGIAGKTEYVKELADNSCVYVMYNIHRFMSNLYKERNMTIPCPDYEHSWRLRPLSERIKNMDEVKLAMFAHSLGNRDETLVRIGWRGPA